MTDPLEKRLERTGDGRIVSALTIIFSYGQIDGDHHKAWVIDQVVRALLLNEYDEGIRDYCCGEDGPDTYSWDIGIAP